MALRDLQEGIKAVIAEAEALMGKDKRTDADGERYATLVAEGKKLKGEIEAAKEMEGIKDWAGKSAGFLPLTKVEDVRPDGSHVVLTDEGRKKDGSRSVFVTDEGENLIDPRTLAVISGSEYKSAFRDYLRRGDMALKGDALKVLQEGADVSGGYLVPDEILSRIIAKEPTPSGVSSRVTRISTSRDAVSIPKVNYATDNIYTSGMRITWTGEVPASATTHRVTEPTFGQVRIAVFTAMLSIPVTRDMVEDSVFPIVNWVSGKFRETIDLLYDDMVLNGTGANRPRGILLNPNGTNEPAQVVSGNASLLTADGLFDLAFALPPQYDNNAVFVFNKTSTGLAIAKLKDGDGRYLWGAGMQDSGLQPGWKGRQLIGYDVVLNELMPNVAANAFPIIFGDLGGYYLVERVGFSIEVLRELYAETNQLLLLGRIRFGGMVAEDWKIKVQKVSA